jgi:putative endonuclease
MGSESGTLYIGFTNDLARRVHEHKTKENPRCFTAQYELDRLLYWEEFKYVNDALAREKEIKGWKRERKIALINESNPARLDLARAWYRKAPADTE